MKRLFHLLFFFFLFSCNKKHADEKLLPTIDNLSGTYSIEKVTMSSNAGGETDVTHSFLQPCERDNYYSLEPNFDYYYRDLGQLCIPDGTYKDKWSLVNEGLLTLSGNPYVIRAFNGTSLVLTVWSNGTTTTYYLVRLNP